MSKKRLSIFRNKTCMSLLAAAAMLAVGCEKSDFILNEESSTPYEADIRYICFDNAEMLKIEADTLFKVYDSRPEVSVNINADMTRIAPKFILTQGANIFMQDSEGQWTIPADGKERDFSEGGQQYMVVSANKKSHRIYTLSFNCQEISTEYHFEWFELNDSTKEADGGWKKNTPHYYTWKELDEDGTYKFSWATANAGFGISKSNNAPTNYPTTPCPGVNGGMGVKLTTMSTGGVAAMLNMRLAAGNLFLGEFDVSTALRDARASTHFGVPFNKKPLQLRGWMSYEPAENYQDREGNIIDMPDSCEVYALLYRNKDENGNTIYLDGNTIATSTAIVCKARISDALSAGTGGEWRYFTADFDYDSFTEPLTPELLAGYGYNLAIVASSSSRGAYFCGAIGSTLKVDELEIVCEK